MGLDITNYYENNGDYPSLGKVYIDSFGGIPNVYAKNFDSEHIIDMVKIDIESIKAAYPQGKVIWQNVAATKESTSAVDFDDIEFELDQSGNLELWIGGGRISSFVVIIFEKEEKIYFLESSGLKIYYAIDDSTIDLEKEVKDLVSLLPLLDSKKNKKSTVDLVCFENGYYTISSKINPVTLDINKCYNDDFQPIYNDIVEFLDSKKRQTGVLIFNGVPGTGKTMFIRHLINTVPGNYILITPSIAAHLAAPEFISFLMTHKDSIFVLEDCETVIMDRKSSNLTSAVAALLNMTDGLMSDIFNIKFICTFNAKITSVDEALLRKGRCFANYEFKALDKEKAKVLLNERGIVLNEYEDMTVADIFNYEQVEKEKEKAGKAKSKIGFI